MSRLTRLFWVQFRPWQSECGLWKPAPIISRRLEVMRKSLLGRIAALAAYCYRRSSVVSLSVGLSVADVRELFTTGWIDRDAVWWADSCGSKDSCIRWGGDLPRKEVVFGGCPAHSKVTTAYTAVKKSVTALIAVYSAKRIIPSLITAHSDRDQAIVNNGTTCDAAFVQICDYLFLPYCTHTEELFKFNGGHVRPS